MSYNNWDNDELSAAIEDAHKALESILDELDIAYDTAVRKAKNAGLDVSLWERKEVFTREDIAGLKVVLSEFLMKAYAPSMLAISESNRLLEKVRRMLR